MTEQPNLALIAEYLRQIIHRLHDLEVAVDSVDIRTERILALLTGDPAVDDDDDIGTPPQVND